MICEKKHTDTIMKTSKIKKEELLECISKNMSQKEIAQHFSVCREYIRKLFQQYDIPIINRRTKPAIEKSLLIQENHVNNLTLKEISKKYDRSYRSIKHMFSKYEIQPKNNTIEKNKREREDKVSAAKKLYGTLTRYELQKELNLGQLYVNEALKHLPYKFTNHSSLEKKIQDHLDSLNIEYFTSCRNIISPRELDIYIPEKKLAIEINGLYWHTTTAKRNIDKKYHLEKTVACKSKSIKLLHFFEDELRDKFEICKSIISSKVGKIQQVYARKCLVKSISYSEAKDFCLNYHLQGSTVASVYLGLFYDGSLVSVMTFRKQRFFKTSTAWEIIRYCTKNNLRIVGGASKLFSHFIKNYSPTEVDSYADLRISDGEIYEKLGFKYSHTTQPNYYYVIGKNRSNRLNWQKKSLSKKLKIFNRNLSEQENMELNGYNRIYDCGNKLYIWKLN